MAAKRRKAPVKKERKPAKPAKAKKPKPSVDAGEEKPGMPIESVLAISTFLMLLVGLVLVDYVRGRDYGEGMFFKDKYDELAASE